MGEMSVSATVNGAAGSPLSPTAGRYLSRNDNVILKVLIIGDPCVGKTSYVQRYVNGTFHRHYKGTIGVDFALKIISWSADACVKVQLWDIAGQERYTSMTRVYYRDAHGCIIMFDLTNRNTFLNVVKWKRDFDSKCITADSAPIPCILIANKCDAEGMRQVTNDEIEKLCREFNFNAWAEVSVKDNYMVDDTIRYLVSCILNQEKTISGSPMESQNSGYIRLGETAETEKKDKKCACSAI